MYEIFDKLCKEYNVTPYKVGKVTGIATSTLSDWKKGVSTPKQNKLKKIADYFHVTVDYLMTGEDTVVSPNAKEAELLVKIRHNKELSAALEKYFTLSADKQKHVIELINLFGGD